MGFRWSETFCPAVIQNLMIERARTHRSIEFLYRCFKLFWLQSQLHGQFRNARCRNRRKNGWHESTDSFRIDDRIGNLILLLRYEASPDCITLRPQIFAFVVKALRPFVNDNAEWHAVEACHDTTVEFRRAAVDGYSMALL